MLGSRAPRLEMAATTDDGKPNKEILTGKKERDRECTMAKDDSNGAPPEAQLAEDSGLGNLDQVRDILFGAHLRDYEQRLDRLEERIILEMGALRQDTKNSLESMELYVRKELDALVKRLMSEQDDRGAALREIAGDIKRVEGDHQAGMVRLDGQLSESERNLHQHILDNVKGLRDEMEQSQAQNASALEREARALRDTKTDRAALGELLMEMAMRLNDEIDSPEEE